MQPSCHSSKFYFPSLFELSRFHRQPHIAPIQLSYLVNKPSFRSQDSFCRPKLICPVANANFYCCRERDATCSAEATETVYITVEPVTASGVSLGATPLSMTGTETVPVVTLTDYPISMSIPTSVGSFTPAESSVFVTSVSSVISVPSLGPVATCEFEACTG